MLRHKCCAALANGYTHVCTYLPRALDLQTTGRALSLLVSGIVSTARLTRFDMICR